MKKLALVTTLIIAATGAYAETAKPAPQAAPAATTAAPAQAKKEHKVNHAVKAKHTEVKAEEVKPTAEKMK
jgi:hypothetical protein